MVHETINIITILSSMSKVRLVDLTIFDFQTRSSNILKVHRKSFVFFFKIELLTHIVRKKSRSIYICFNNDF